MPPLVELLFVSRYNIYNRMDIMTPQMDGITDGKRPELCTFKHSR